MDSWSNFALLAKARLCMVMSGLRAGVVMAEQVPTIDEIDSAEKLGAYLRTRPVEEAQLLALRLAVRVMPVVSQFLSKPFAFQMKSGLIGAIFRCTLISWAAGNFPAHETPGMIASLASAGSAAAFAAAGLSFSASASAFASFAASASASAARATFVLSSDSAIGFASAVASAVASASDEIWLVIRSDLRRMAQLGVPPVLRSGLWEDQQLPGRIGADEKDFRRALLTLGDHWLPVWDFYFAVRNGEAPYAHLKDRQEEVLVGIATENEEFWNRDPDVVMKEIAARLWAAESVPYQNVPQKPPEPELGPGPHYDIIDGKLGIVASPPHSDEVNPQTKLFERLRRDIDRLVSAAHKIDNSHPNLAFSIREYAALLDTSLDALDVTGVWVVGGSLAGFAQSFREQNRNRTLAEPLEPEVDGLLQSVIRQHGAFIMGFEEGRDLVDRADRFALDPEKFNGLEESGNPLIAELASNADLVNDDARAVHRSVNGYLQEFGWTTGRVGYAAYLLVRNAVRAVIRGLAFYGFKDAVEDVRDQSGFPSSTAAISFLYYFASPLLVFFANFPEMHAYVQWALYITRQVYESDSLTHRT
ncbi:hypothetical protein [Agrobacterium vitis]|uniref:hypothetical protein n=1 Tax=Agrobacterium vitis TaxID=373 RepID=UPI0012E87265|nr:hypothetical protein [Agrobacterium vitis]MVA34035.1 hypothetical protein [Agrobacterium vitis]